jgi:hypothetical protein
MTRRAVLFPAAVLAVAAGLAACQINFAPTAPPRPTPTPMANCQMKVPSGWIFVQFRADVTGERAHKLIEGLGVQRVPFEKMMTPIAFPIPAPDDEGFWEGVAVPPGEEGYFVEAFERLPEVVRAVTGWPGCPPP